MHIFTRARRHAATVNLRAQSPSSTNFMSTQRAQIRHILRKPAMQTKLTVGAPNDVYEQEADRVADQVMRMSEPAFGEGATVAAEAAPSVQRLCHECGEELQRQLVEEEQEEQVQRQAVDEQQEEEPIQAKPAAEGAGPLSAPLESTIRALRGGGQPLPAAERAFFEARFGQDFAHVRIHTDASAAQAAQSVRARAFTLGHDVVFSAGAYRPSASDSRRLLAHELTHVVQQTGGAQQGESSEASDTLRRVAWEPYSDTGQTVAPWPSLPGITGTRLIAMTDANREINTWRPDDRRTYWCHGYTFGGSRFSPPYSTWGRWVPRILQDDGWSRINACLSRANDILVFYGPNARSTGGIPKHSGIIRHTETTSGGGVDEGRSTLESKWGSGAQDTLSWTRNVGSGPRSYGKYAAYSKSPMSGPCRRAPNELP